MAARLVRPVPALLVALLVAASLAAFAAPPAHAGTPTSDTYFWLNTIGSAGAGPGYFGGTTNPGPYGVATDSQGRVYVADPNNDAAPLQKFTADGTYVCPVAPYGGSAGQVMGAYGVAVGPNDVVYAVDTWRGDSNRIQKFSWSDSEQKYVSAGVIATPEVTSGKAFSIAVDTAGNVYLTRNTGDVVKYSAAGTFVATIDPGLTSAYCVAVDDGGDLYVGESGCVKKLHSDDGTTYTVTATWTGTVNGQDIAGPRGLAVDAQHNLYVADDSRCRIVKLDATGAAVTCWGSAGSGNEQFNDTYSVAVSPGGAVYVADAVNRRVTRFGRDATPPEVTPSVSPAVWTNAASVTIGLSASDPTVADQYHSGMRSASPLQYDLGSGWTDYADVLTVTDEGRTDVPYRAYDNVGSETSGTASAFIDRTPPTTGVSGIPAGWSKKAVTATFTRSDAKGPLAVSGVADTQYSINGGATWQSAVLSRAPITRLGTTTLRYRSIDFANNTEVYKSATVRVDTARPVPKVLANRTVYHGRVVSLPYRVGDAANTPSKIVIKLFRAGVLKKTLSLGYKPSNVTLSYAYRCWLPAGTYSWVVYATDIAGNTQLRPSSARLVVR